MKNILSWLFVYCFFMLFFLNPQLVIADENEHVTGILSPSEEEGCFCGNSTYCLKKLELLFRDAATYLENLVSSDKNNDEALVKENLSGARKTCLKAKACIARIKEFALQGKNFELQREAETQYEPQAESCLEEVSRLNEYYKIKPFIDKKNMILDEYLRIEEENAKKSTAAAIENNLVQLRTLIKERIPNVESTITNLQALLDSNLFQQIIDDLKKRYKQNIGEFIKALELRREGYIEFVENSESSPNKLMNDTIGLMQEANKKILSIDNEVISKCFPELPKQKIE